MDLTDAEASKLTEARLALSQFLSMLQDRNEIKSEQIVFLLQEGWEVTVTNVGAMERRYLRDHGEDEKRNANGG